MLRTNRFSQTLAARAIHPLLSAPANVDIVQYGDFECAECGRVAASLQTFRHRNEGAIDFHYKHFPFSAVHPHALQAAEAVECARSQGQFWPMHNLLYADQRRLDLRSLYGHAESIGLDMERFNAEMDDEVHIPIIRSHIYSGRLAGVKRTPAYFVDGVLISSSGGLRSLFDAASDASTVRRRRFGRGLSGG
jgi:protein-disulfide isomerase